jgi:hypothetical protein
MANEAGYVELQRSEARRLRWAPLERRDGASQRCERRCNVRVAWHKASVVVAEADEPTNFRAGGGGGPFAHRLHLARVHLDPFGRDAVSQEPKLLSPELALGGFGKKAPFS